MDDSRTGVAILGSTGSIGRQTIEVLQAHGDRFRIVGLVAGRDGSALAEQAGSLGVERTGLGPDAAAELATMDEAEVVVNAVVGAAGLTASVAALRAGKRLALANKESLVAGGDVCRLAGAEGGGEIVPIDSEHAAIAQCLKGRDPSTIHRVTITASGGPFRKRTDLDDVRVEDALAHPTWEMGRKITVDSATLMNKGLEVIEAHHLFGLHFDDIGVLVHPQSVIHGLVEFTDGSQILQAGPADMRIPIAMALGIEGGPAFSRMDLKDVAELTFEPVDDDRFPALGLAYDAGRKGGTHPAALNASNEVAVGAFLDERIHFVDIPVVVERVVERHEGGPADEMGAVLEADRWARAEAEDAIEAMRT